ncbi:MAG: type VI secretion system protein ImpH [Pseudohongiellaceae bacterium]|jgi:type VI secretion system protein ImpH
MSADGLLASDIDDFFHLVRSIERQAYCDAAVTGDSVTKVGHDNGPEFESIRFKGNTSLSFSGRSIGSHKLLKSGETEQSRHEIVVNFMGLAGSSGILPKHYTRIMQERLKNKDTALRDFLDLFNHRLIALFYRAWEKYRIAFQHESYMLTAQADPFTKVLKSLSGQHVENTFDPQLFYAGHFQRQVKSANNLKLMLQDLLSMSVDIHSFSGQWLPINKRDRFVITSQHANKQQRLGSGLLAGSRYWDISSKITIEFGSVSYRRYTQLLPGEPKRALLEKLINNYVAPHLNVDLVFNIKSHQTTLPRLGGIIKLGQTLWLNSDTKNSLRSHTALQRKVVSVKH